MYVRAEPTGLLATERGRESSHVTGELVFLSIDTTEAACGVVKHFVTYVDPVLSVYIAIDVGLRSLKEIQGNRTIDWLCVILNICQKIRKVSYSWPENRVWDFEPTAHSVLYEQTIGIVSLTNPDCRLPDIISGNRHSSWVDTKEL